jgi:NADPH:quinone reductase-like Zn-dependent oxidoreductase
MKAIQFTKYGSPDVLRLVEVDKPLPTENQVLIKVHAASANPLDWHAMRGSPFLVRLSDGFLSPKSPKLGSDVAGRVEAVGSNVTEFKPGDEVFGCGWGSFAEYVCVRENRLALKPSNISFEQAAAAPVAALTALQGLRDHGKVGAGQKVLINGSAGGVGTYAVQIAKSHGAEVTAVCSGRNLEMVRSIGANHVIDYTQEDFTKSEKQYDLIYDTVSNHLISQYARALTPQGICVLAGFSNLLHLAHVIVMGSLASRYSSKKIGLMGLAAPNKEDLTVIAELLKTGKVTSVIDKTYPLSETAEAVRYLEKGHARGKVVITI